MPNGYIAKKKGQYYVVLALPGDATRKRVLKWLSVRKELNLDHPALYKDAKELLTRKMTELSTLGTIASSDLSFAAFLENWLQTKQNIVAATTHELYTGILKRYVTSYSIAHQKLTKITPLVLQKHVDQLVSDGKPLRSIQLTVMILRQALKAAVSWDMIPRNPAASLALPKYKAAEKRIWTDEEAARFLAAIKGDDLELVYRTAMETGMRRGEILGLTWHCISYSEKRIYVKKSLNVHRVLSDVKTDKSDRAVAVSDTLIEAYRQHQKTQAERLMVTGIRNDLQAVFLTSAGTLYIPRNVLRHFQLICKRSNLPVVDLHSLRHLHVSWLLESGLDFKTIQDRVGHSRVQTTMDIYAHLANSMRDRAAAVADEKIASLENVRTLLEL